MTDETLGPDDYAALHGLLLSGNPEGLALAKKLTPTEQQAFFDYQQQANKGKGERAREDNSVLGMPPELAVTAAIPVARAVAGAGATVAAKATAAAGAAVPQLAAQAKFWLTKRALVKMGVPEVFADGIAVVASGLKKGAPKGEPPAIEAPAAGAEGMPPTPPVAAPAPAEPVVAGPGAGTPPVPPGAGLVAPPPIPAPAPSSPPMNALPDQKALNEAALAARRAAYQAKATEMPAPAPSAKPSLLASEAKEYLKLLQSGKTAKDAMAAILAQRAFQAKFGLPMPTAAETTFPKGMRGRSQD